MNRREFLGAGLLGAASILFGRHSTKTKNIEFENHTEILDPIDIQDQKTAREITPENEIITRRLSVEQCVLNFLHTDNTDTPHNIPPATQEHEYRHYSPQYDTIENRSLGKKYLAEIIGKAWQRLAEANLNSRAHGISLKVHDTVPPELIASIILVEHLGYRDLQRAETPQDQESVVCAPLVMFGLNREHTYNNEVSSRDARGIAQLRRIAYMDACGATAENYTCTNPLLTGNVDADSINHETAIIAMYCLMDNNFNAIPQADRQRLVIPKQQHSEQTLRELGEYSAVAYNAGATALRRIIREHGVEWRNHAPGDYLERFVAIWNEFNTNQNI